MSGFEYKVVPAPTRGLKAKGVRGTPALFANTLQTIMNELGAAGWEYQRTDTLPVQERQGLTGKTTTFQNMLVFRRALEVEMPVAEAATPPTALIEDHSETVSEEQMIANTPQPAMYETDSSMAQPHATGEMLVHEAPEAMADDEDPAQKGTFVFPWNKRLPETAGDRPKSRPAAE